ncbi:MAG: hypothetical protein IT422_02305 [Pirellulaceae bacterium]|nr:hypothetical protein [Pirellulaceae bacterium]
MKVPLLLVSAFRKSTSFAGDDLDGRDVSGRIDDDGEGGSVVDRFGRGCGDGEAVDATTS